MPELTKERILALATQYDADFNPNSPEIVIERAEGATLTDTNGHTSIDLSDIIMNVGHRHPRHVAALKAALDVMITNKSGQTNAARAQLVKRLVDITPDNLDKVYLVSEGSEAIDWAVKIARRYTGKHEILAFWGGVYGRTYAASSLNGLMRRKRQFGPVMPGVLHAPYPNCYRCPFGKQPKDCDMFCIDFLDQVMQYESTDDLAAVIVEPYQGVGGMVFPPEGYLTRLQEWCEARDVLFILDEVQSSFGRTGKIFALEWENLRPDMICIGKGLGSGIAIAGVIGESRLFDALDPGELSGGNGGNFFAASSALAVLDIMEEEKLPEHALEIGTYLLSRFKQLQSEFNVIGDVRGKGLSIAMEFVKDPVTKEPYPEIVRQIQSVCYENGVYFGSRSHILDVRPPLVITQAQAEHAADVIEAALRAALNN
ncbi:MAG: 4-aminobutyrate--2-oxoglutarate transaminase [Anaerolineaceae bacterium]|nr:4-aminobutyrate--2-oxoglutarate transaminase [Anaerolineaceae bacterium]